VPETIQLPPVAILCGGRGTRLQQRTPLTPKALVEIGGRPILWHVIRIYIEQGFREFTLLTGYLAGAIRAFAEETDWPADVTVRCLETGLDTPTGGRIHRALAQDALGDGEFCLTYADGVADLDLTALVAAHRRSGLAATVTVVRPELQFGVVDIDGEGIVRGFVEKPRSERWVNGGFFCLSPAIADVLSDDAVLEREPLAQLARRGQLRAFRHEGFWDCMDTYKDAMLLNDLWDSGRAPWKMWA
jgi:glucose-1-phosphate cytidylyltransferase